MEPQKTILLLNASNLKTALMYPYAFVQVSEIADRFGIHTVRNDMYGISEDQWEANLQKLLKKKLFDMILITLRNTDTCDSNDYRKRSKNTNYHQQNVFQPPEPLNYYPIDATKLLIQILRKLTNIPIVIGGYAFSKLCLVMPERIMKYLQPDYGVIGGPDAFFKHFEDILDRQDLDQIANLVYYHSGALQTGPRQFFPPAPRREYTDEIIADRLVFYSRFPGDNGELSSVPIEAVRGCAMKCSFCSEPLVEGRKVQHRDLDVIEDEINFLRKYRLNQLFFICSEINTDSNEYLMNLADRIIEINEEREEYEKISWYVLHLMTLSTDELKHIRKAGFLEGSNDVVSLDDNNLAATKAPLRTNQIIRFFTQAKKLVREEFRQNGRKFYSLEERIFRYPQSLNPDDFMNAWNIFLGNIEVTPKTIRTTLKRADEAKLNQFFDSCYVNKATRLYDYIHPTDEILKYTWSSVNGIVKKSYNELYPSFVYPPALLRHFGSDEVLEEFFELVGDTYLSLRHLFKKDWNWFLANNLDSKTFLFWWNSSIESQFDFNNFTQIPEVLDFLSFLRNNPSANNINLFFNPTPGRRPLMNFAANIAVQFVLFSQEKDLTPIMQYLGLPPNLEATLNLSPYKVAVKFFERYSNKDELYLIINESSFNKALSRFFVDYLIYLNNIPFKAEYQIFFVPS
ncbi:MAG: hypothetical protein ACFFB5_07465 [Promethearchaeota archaeon]